VQGGSWRYEIRLAVVLLGALTWGPALALAREKAPDQPSEWTRALKDIPLGPLHLSLGAELRLRFESDHQFDVRGYAPGVRDHFLLERFRLTYSLRWKRWVRLFVELRDAHIFGSRLDRADFPSKNPVEDSLDIRQAYLEAFFHPSHFLGLRIGRQQIGYGDVRVFGPGTWGNTGRYVWDAAMLKLRLRYLQLDLWAGRFVINLPQDWPNRWSDGPTAVVGYAKIRRLPLRLDLFYALKLDWRGQTVGESGTGNLQSHSVGFQLEGTLLEGLFDYGATFVTQLGRWGADRLLAFGANGKLGFVMPAPWRPRLGVQLTWGSGDRDATDGVHGTFDGVFGGADLSLYGQMNLFFWANLRDYEIDFAVWPAKGLKALVEYHFFTLDEANDAWYTTGLKPLRRDPTGAAGSELGHEIDVRIHWSPLAELALILGYSHFFPGRFVRATGRTAHADWVMLQAKYGF